MNRSVIISAGICLCVSTSLAAAQGVPTQDNAAIGQTIARVTALVQDLGVQGDKDTDRASLADVQVEQLRTLEAISAAITGSTSVLLKATPILGWL
jgi:hypothetical protein